MSNTSVKKLAKSKKNVKPNGTYTIKNRKSGVTTKNFIYQEANAVVKPGVYAIRISSVELTEKRLSKKVTPNKIGTDPYPYTKGYCYLVKMNPVK
jgi:hypothetical protein